MKNILNHFQKLKIYYIVVIVLSVFGSIMILLSTQSMSTLTTNITQSGMEGFIPYVILVMMYYLIYILIEQVLFKLTKDMIQKYINQKIYIEISQTINTNSIEKLDFYNKGDFYSLIQTDTESGISFLSDTLIDIIYQLIRIILVLIYISVINITLSLIYISMTLLSMFIQKKFSSVVAKANKKTKKEEAKMNEILENVLDNRIIIKTYCANEFSKNLYQPKVEKYTESYLFTESKALPFRMIGIFLGLLPILSLCVGGIYFIEQGTLSLTTFLSIEYICNYVVYDQLHFSDFITESVKAFVSVKRIVDFNIKQENIHTNQTNDINLSSISYHYPNTDRIVLNDISIHIPYGEKIAIVGKSGCGKSTLLKMIAGWIKQDTGTTDLPDITFAEQFPYLFTDTVKNNITCWKNVNEEEYQYLLSICKINDFLQDDQMILEKNGSNLSGGQKQRISLARALMNHKDVILFDESFSGIDSNNALEILQSIIKEYPKETMVFTIHQLELLKEMDRIIVMENGSIVFDGTYQEYEAKYGKE